MNIRKAVFFYKRAVEFCAVALMKVKTVLRKLLVELCHFFVAVRFGDN